MSRRWCVPWEETIVPGVGRAVVALSILSDDGGFEDHWFQGVDDGTDLENRIARLLAWHREDGMLKGDERVVVCTGWWKGARPKGEQLGLFGGAS